MLKKTTRPRARRMREVLLLAGLGLLTIVVSMAVAQIHPTQASLNAAHDLPAGMLFIDAYMGRLMKIVSSSFVRCAHLGLALLNVVSWLALVTGCYGCTVEC